MTETKPGEGAPATPEPPPTSDEGSTPPDTIPFKEFLETVHPSVTANVSGLWLRPEHGFASPRMATPDLRLHCQGCDGERTFRCNGQHTLERAHANARFITYMCGNCRRHAKSFALYITVSEAFGVGVAYKYGERPSFGIPVPNKMLRLFGEDRENFLKGRQCENQGLGVGAFAYYRRVVENHKNEIFDAIIAVCETVGAPQELVQELNNAKREISFTKAMEQIKTALPQGLLIDGHNPLVALHSALSIGLHNDSDTKCLEAAQDVRLVLTDLVERMALLRQENSELKNAVQRLFAKKGDV